MGKVNAELSPFKDDEQRDSVFMREMLDHYRTYEDFDESTSERQIERHSFDVHSYLKQMEVGSKHKDAKLLKRLQDGEIKRDNKKMNEYLVRRLQAVPKAM